MWSKKRVTPDKPRTKTAEQALASLMRLCARAEKCEGDARRLMRNWGVTPSDAEQVLARLVRDRFIDDSRYAAMYVREKAHLNGWGAYKIRTALRRKEVAAHLIDEALGQLDTTKMASRLHEQLQCKMRTIKAKTPYDLRNKLLRYGLSLGYDFETVREAVDASTPNSPDTFDSCEAFSC